MPLLAFLIKGEGAGGEPEKMSHQRDNTKHEETNVIRH